MHGLISGAQPTGSIGLLQSKWHTIHNVYSYIASYFAWFSWHCNVVIFLTDSDFCSRQCLGAGRHFSMSITDNNQVEVIHLERPCRCACGLQEMEVHSPPGTIIGYVKPE